MSSGKIKKGKGTVPEKVKDKSANVSDEELEHAAGGFIDMSMLTPVEPVNDRPHNSPVDDLLKSLSK